MAVEILTGTLNNADDDDVSLDLMDENGNTVGTLNISRDSWDNLDPGVDTIVISGLEDVDVDDE